jgi:hypothetical protein
VDGYEVHQVGGLTILEYWISAEDLPDLSANIIGAIEVVAEYAGPRRQASASAIGLIADQATGA